MASGWAAYAPLTRTVFWSSAHSSFSALLSPDGGPLGIAEGWYWAAALAVVFLVTTVWYRRAGRGGPGPGLPDHRAVLTAAVTAVPLLLMPRVPLPAWLWLTSQWDSGTFALLIIAVGLWDPGPPRARSRLLAIVALAYTAAALAVDWPALRSAPSALIVTDGDPLRTLSYIDLQSHFRAAAVLPALVLLAAALPRRGPLAGPGGDEFPPGARSYVCQVPGSTDAGVPPKQRS